MSDSDTITCCPQCNTAFRVTNNQLTIAGGMVRCGSCLGVFKALDYKITIATRAQKTTELPSLQPIDSSVSSSQPVVSAAKLTQAPAQKTTAAIYPDPQKHKSLAQLISDSEDESAQFFKNNTDESANRGDNKVSSPDRESALAAQRNRKATDESWILEESDYADDIYDKRDTRSVKNPQLKSKAAKSDATGASESFQAIPDSRSMRMEASIGHASATDESTGNLKSHSRVSKKATAGGLRKSGKRMEKFSQISETEIESAIDDSTSYTGDSKSYVYNIEPAPVELEWFESEITRRWLWVAAAILASALLLIQIAIFRFETLSRVSTYRPIYQSVCRVLDCEVPALVDLKQVRTTNLVVRNHPDRKDVLVVDAILLNVADFRQPFPGLKLEFSALDNRLIAARVFQPGDYLRGEMIGATQMPSRQPIQLSLEIVDPGSEAVNYQLSVVSAERAP
ncbi:MAG: putative Zn finger-like uncharacterized protein [Cellvibrionaceae bacterium]|jgi:predicted Zn finger-like uncharacterized protein